MQTETPYSADLKCTKNLVQVISASERESIKRIVKQEREDAEHYEASRAAVAKMTCDNIYQAIQARDEANHAD